MTNMFDYLKTYVNMSSTDQYGDILNDNIEDKTLQLLDVGEKDEYLNIKKNDIERLMKSSGNQYQQQQSNNNNVQYNNISMPGIGEVQQLC